MTNLERRAYEPRIDKIPEFDVADEKENVDDGSRLPLLIVIALVVLAAFAGVVWLAYTQGVERGRADTPRVVIAGGRPSKAEGSQSSLTGLKIYQTSPNVSGSTSRAHAKSPASEVPALRSSANSVADSPDEAPAMPSASPTLASRPAPAMPVQAPPAPRIATKPPAPPRDVATLPPQNTAEPASPPTTPLQGIMLQIGSYKSQAEASESWRAFKARHAVVAGYRFDVNEANLGSRGVWYRLRVGPFAGRPSAVGVCEKLRAEGANCLVTR
ncbi:MAG TPA: SPOR domain-containing protein [Rhizomicrobium sp.]|nr:SPOR domain-containing protein [Rhizomicrobium sp.]